jgi:ABC-type uncharacterized transport system substrate-binding protein
MPWIRSICAAVSGSRVVVPGRIAVALSQRRQVQEPMEGSVSTVGFSRLPGWAALILTAVVPIAPAAAHPHVWVTVQTTLLYEGGHITGLRHAWTFDDAYTEMAVDGLDVNGDGIYSREELAELAKVNIDGLKEFGYFTYPKLGTTAIAEKDPIDYYLEYKDKLLTLHFTLPFEHPVQADAKGFNFSVFDESFFIAFDFGKGHPVVLGAGAPQGCAVNIAIPQNELDQLQALNKSFGGQLTAGDANVGMGMGYAKTVSLECKKS